MASDNRIMAMGEGDAKSAGLAKRLIPLAALAAAIAAFFALDLDTYLTFDALRDNRAALKVFVADNGALAVLCFVSLYALAVALSVPGAVIFTLAGGFMFGALLGTVYVVVAATIGATALFLIARTALGDILRNKAGRFVRRMEEGFKDNALSYLLVLRLVPAFPFWAVNLVPALFGVKLSTFVLATAIGIVPGTFVFATFGAGLGQIFDAGGEVSLRSVVTPGILAGLIGLAVLALIPIAVKKLKARKV